MPNIFGLLRRRKFMRVKRTTHAKQKNRDYYFEYYTHRDEVSCIETLNEKILLFFNFFFFIITLQVRPHFPYLCTCLEMLNGKNSRPVCEHQLRVTILILYNGSLSTHCQH